ncbi:hypothetical protein D3C86_1832930 [compost metagenome]
MPKISTSRSCSIMKVSGLACIQGRTNSGSDSTGKNTGDRNSSTVVSKPMVCATSRRNTPNDASTQPTASVKTSSGKSTTGVQSAVQGIWPMMITWATSRIARLTSALKPAESSCTKGSISSGNTTFFT